MTAHGSAGVSLLEYALRKKKKKRKTDYFADCKR